MPRSASKDNLTVSVIIPTIGRSSLLASVNSARRQSVATEIIVVLDAPLNMPAVAAMLSGIPHKLLETTGQRGGAHARNLGLREASGRYIAYLDDDDIWEPEKLSMQLDLLCQAAVPSHAVCVTATAFHRIQGDTLVKNVVPRNMYNPRIEDILDYLVQRRDIRYGRNFMQTSSILGPADLLKTIIWDESLPKHQDWDLFARLLAPGSGVDVYQLMKPMVCVYQNSTQSVSATPNWQASEAFFEKHRMRMSPRTRADFVWSQILRSSLAQRSVSGIFRALAHIFEGVPHFFSIVVGLSGVRRR